MRTVLSLICAALAFGLAAAARAENAPALTQWDQSQDSLVRQFSHGFGFAIDQAHPFLVARVDSASTGWTAGARNRHDRPLPQPRHTYLPSQSR